MPSPDERDSDYATEVDRKNRKNSQDDHISRSVRRAETSEPHRGCSVEWQEYEEAQWQAFYPLVGEVAKLLVHVGRDESLLVETRDQADEAHALVFRVVS